jgi:hypothetical protein
MYTGIGLDRLESSFGLEELFFVGAIWVDGHFLAMRFSNAENLLILQVHIHILLVESISLRNEADQLMQGYGDERQVLQIDVEEIGRDAPYDGLMADDKD